MMEQSFDVTNRIKELCKERNMSFYRLSKSSDIPQTTLTNILNRGTVPSIYTLERICDALGITLSQFFSTHDDTYELTADQKQVIDLYIQLSPDDKRLVVTYMQGLLKILPEA